MSKIDPHFAYFSILSVIQPASIEEIEAEASSVLGPEHGDILVDSGDIRWAHENALKNGAIIKVKKGKYFIARWAKSFVRLEGLEKSIDNRRLFMMKLQRKRRKHSR